MSSTLMEITDFLQIVRRRRMPAVAGSSVDKPGRTQVLLLLVEREVQ